MGVRAGQASSGSGTLTSDGMSLSGGGPDADGQWFKSSGGSGHLCKAWDPVVISIPVASSGLGACSPEPPATWGSSRSVVSSGGLGMLWIHHMWILGEGSPKHPLL